MRISEQNGKNLFSTNQNYNEKYCHLSVSQGVWNKLEGDAKVPE